MREPSSIPERRETHPETAPGREPSTGTPRWVKVFGIVALVLIALFVILQLLGVGGSHGPSRHSQPAGEFSGAPSSFSVMAGSVQLR